MLIEQLNKGIIPWRKEWVDSSGGRFMNYRTKKPYSGINPWIISAKFQPHHCAYFLTKKQIEDHGGTLNKDATRFTVVYYGKALVTENSKPTEAKPHGDSFERLIRFLKEYTVYNLADTTGIDWRSKLPIITEKQKIANCEKVYELMPKKPILKHGGNRAYYSPGTDQVQMPVLSSFNKEQYYYSTLFHELIHSTGHPKRLKRDFSGRFGNKEYALEELIAEIGAGYLCAHSGILLHTKKNTVAYLQNWMKALTKEAKDNKTFFFKAASQSQKAANFILSKQLKEKSRSTSAKKADVPRPIDTAPVVKPDKSKKASIQAAVKDVLSLPKYKGISPMLAQMIFSDFKEKDLLHFDEVGAMKQKMYEKAEEKGLLEFTDDWYLLTTESMHLIDAINGRLRTLKAKKQGNDMFPHLAGSDKPEKPKGSINPFVPVSKVESGGTFRLDGDLGELLGDLGIHECSITLEGDQGAGKSQLAWQLANGFAAKGKRVGIFCPEMKASSPVITRYRDTYIAPENLPNVGINDSDDMTSEMIGSLANHYDVAIVDSFTNLKGYTQFQFTELFKSHPDKIIIGLFQRTTSGEIRGGNKPVFDAYMNIECAKVDDSFVNNYAVCTKNRFGATGPRYNISKRKIITPAAATSKKKVLDKKDITTPKKAVPAKGKITN
jgi:antirestriction protein ArdC